jgi:hypothetical protein
LNQTPFAFPGLGRQFAKSHRTGYLNCNQRVPGNVALSETNGSKEKTMPQRTLNSVFHFGRKVSELLWVPLVLLIGNAMGHGISGLFLP